MKRVFVLLILFQSAIHSNAQSVKIKAFGDPIEVSKVLVLDSSQKKDKLYSLGNEWFVNVFHNPKLVMQMQDKDASIIIGKCSLSRVDTLKTTLSGPIYSTIVINYMIKLSFKDGKIKYDVSDFVTDAGTAINNGEVVLEGFPQVAFVSKKKMSDYYIRAYKNDQIACRNECDLISLSIENFFKKNQNTSNW